MKRQRNLYQKICSLDNLYLAFHKAVKGKRDKSYVREFNIADIMKLRDSLLHGTYEIGNYNYFKIYDPKERLICAAPFSERILHHAIMNVCEDIFENNQIYDSYACRKGKGLHKAVLRLSDWAGKNTFCLKMDIRKYFDSIDHDILLNLISRRIKDRDLIQLFSEIIDCYCINKNKGIPIGNLTSQYFANFYLSYMDRYIKEKLKVRYYLRYMDDFLLLSRDKAELKSWLHAICRFLQDDLMLCIKPPVIRKVSDGIIFCGYKVYNNRIHLSARSKNRFRRKFIQYERNYLRGIWDIDDLCAHIVPLISFTLISDANNYRKGIIYEAVSKGRQPCAPRWELE